jgi:hypothetical protein
MPSRAQAQTGELRAPVSAALVISIGVGCAQFCGGNPDLPAGNQFIDVRHESGIREEKKKLVLLCRGDLLRQLLGRSPQAACVSGCRCDRRIVRRLEYPE